MSVAQLRDPMHRQVELGLLASRVLQIVCADPDNAYEARIHEKLCREGPRVPTISVGLVLKELAKHQILISIDPHHRHAAHHYKPTWYAGLLVGLASKTPMSMAIAPESEQKNFDPQFELDLIDFHLTGDYGSTHLVTGLITILKKAGINSETDLRMYGDEVYDLFGIGSKRKELLRDFISNPKQYKSAA